MTNTKGMTMPQIDDAELFGNAEDQRAYEDFCAIGDIHFGVIINE